MEPPLSSGAGEGLARPSSPVINLIAGGISDAPRTRKEQRAYQRPWEDEAICFSEKDGEGVVQPHDDAVVLALKMGTYRVRRVLVDTSSSADILYCGSFIDMGYKTESLRPVKAPLTGFSGGVVNPLGVITILVVFGTAPRIVTIPVDFLVVDVPSAYNAIIGRKTLNMLGAVVSSYYLKVKFPTEAGIGEEKGQQ